MVSVHLRVAPALLEALDEAARHDFPYATKAGGARMQAIRKACTQYVERQRALQTCANEESGISSQEPAADPLPSIEDLKLREQEAPA